MDHELHNRIIQIDLKYIEKYYNSGERFICDCCRTTKKYKKYYWNAEFQEMPYGYVLKCYKKNKTYPLNKYLQEANKDHKGHAIARWRIGSTGRNFNCPNPPKDFLDEIKRERRAIYKKQEQEIKEINYLKKYGKLP